MNYDDEMLQEINRNADLLAYAEQAFTFIKRGEHYFTNCPLHTDKTPSLCFTPERNSFNCFSCGKSGGMIGYLMCFEDLKFEEAVEKAARLAEVDLSKMCQSKTMTFLKRWREILRLSESSKYEHKILPETTMDKFSIAEVPEWTKEGISKEAMDFFEIRIDDDSNRIVYPVYDIEGNLINVKGRTRYSNFKALKLAKYINYYPVGLMDYFQCLNKTLPYIEEEKEIIIFESIKSVMKAYDWDYRHCVSAENHVLTTEQISLLVKLRVDVVFAYDSDVSYKEQKVRENIDKLRRVTNVYVIEDWQKLLGGAEAKNSPADCGKEVWEKLYSEKRKVV